MEGAERAKKVFKQNKVNRFALKRCILYGSKPESPDFIIWENLGIPFSTRFVAGSKQILLMMFVELVTIFLMEEIQRISADHHRAVETDFCPSNVEAMTAAVSLYTHQLTRPDFICFCKQLFLAEGKDSVL